MNQHLVLSIFYLSEVKTPTFCWDIRYHSQINNFYISGSCATSDQTVWNILLWQCLYTFISYVGLLVAEIYVAMQIYRKKLGFPRLGAGELGKGGMYF